MLKDNRVCDRCNTSHGRDGKYWVKCMQDSGSGGPYNYNFVHGWRMDLCNKCAEEFCEWVDAGPYSLTGGHVRFDNNGER